MEARRLSVAARLRWGVCLALGVGTLFVLVAPAGASAADQRKLTLTNASSWCAQRDADGQGSSIQMNKCTDSETTWNYTSWPDPAPLYFLACEFGGCFQLGDPNNTGQCLSITVNINEAQLGTCNSPNTVWLLGGSAGTTMYNADAVYYAAYHLTALTASAGSPLVMDNTSADWHQWNFKD
jgi:hypothetical protein